MANNPLQQYFRQPKIFIGLASKGIYNEPGSLTGNLESMPVFGMTGMDEIIIRTPDALLSGESTVKVLESCCPSIKNGWDISTLDTNLLFTAIRIATYGNMMAVTHTCPGCNNENDYDLDLGKAVEHYSNCKFDNRVVVDNLVIKIRPLNYRQNTDINIKNFQMQQQLSQVESISDPTEQQKKINELFAAIGLIQNDMITDCVDSVEIETTNVTERGHIKEWLENCDKSIFDSIKKQIEENQKTWLLPNYKVKCKKCDKDNEVSIELDNSNFFA